METASTTFCGCEQKTRWRHQLGSATGVNKYTVLTKKYILTHLQLFLFRMRPTLGLYYAFELNQYSMAVCERLEIFFPLQFTSTVSTLFWSIFTVLHTVPTHNLYIIFNSYSFEWDIVHVFTKRMNVDIVSLSWGCICIHSDACSSVLCECDVGLIAPYHHHYHHKC